MISHMGIIDRQCNKNTMQVNFNSQINESSTLYSMLALQRSSIYRPIRYTGQNESAQTASICANRCAIHRPIRCTGQKHRGQTWPL